ncbi:PQQ-binding-like beta-propeller repeat protein [uncultured Cyclobacterium sp.]|uniref:PQQ-binding-like beta-propeller repeat protein n=1 Tax=uncultured Cyclobacterium sp. TaxID=453820 RepID=UPI0030EF34EC
MPFNKKLSILPFLIVLFVFAFCNRKEKSQLVWESSFPIIGSQSSPRATDLNNDGVLDFVIGAGKNEYEYTASGVLAINGMDGELRWTQETVDQVFGSATFLDINQDETPDVFIGGRGPHLKAIDGRTGDLIWQFDTLDHLHHPILQNARFNFYNSVTIPDQNGDGIEELLTSNGGNAKVEPNQTEGRFPGVLMVIDPVNGDILAADTMPDGGETYLSPLFIEQKKSGEQQVLFGSGGETLSGNLYLAKLSDLMGNNLSNAKTLVREKSHGFIAPPVLVDLNEDEILDIVSVSHASTLTAICGKSFEEIWQLKIPNTESSNSFAVGQFTGDDIPDLFTFVSKGVWPQNTGLVQVLVDGKSGEILLKKEMGCSGFSSPIAYDLNGDQIDEVIFSINEYDCNRPIDDRSAFSIENKLVLMDFEADTSYLLDQTKSFKNIFSTPWLGDIDADGYLDLVHCQYFSNSDILSFLGMKVKRIDLPIRIKEKPLWGSFMGSEGKAIYKK